MDFISCKKLPFTILFCLPLFACDSSSTIFRDIDKVLTESTVPTDGEIAAGLKEALEKGTRSGVSQLAQQGGYLNDFSVRIPFPKDAEKVENTLRDIGLGDEVDKVVVSLNRAAEAAVDEAKPLFMNAIKEMTLTDVRNILFGKDTAATHYLRSKTATGLMNAFQPQVKNALDQVNATKYWNDIISRYNRIPLTKEINPDLDKYVTQKAIDGLFLKIALEEQAIRESPIERTSALLKKVFGYADQQGN
jgi:hypothetical protein